MNNYHKRIQFPPVEVQEEFKLNRFLTTIAGFMNVDIELQEVKIIQAHIDDKLQDVITVLNKIFASQKKKRQWQGQ